MINFFFFSFIWPGSADFILFLGFTSVCSGSTSVQADFSIQGDIHEHGSMELEQLSRRFTTPTSSGFESGLLPGLSFLDLGWFHSFTKKKVSGFLRHFPIGMEEIQLCLGGSFLVLYACRGFFVVVLGV